MLSVTALKLQDPEEYYVFIFFELSSYNQRNSVFSPEHWRKQLCCALGAECPQRELAFISKRTHLRICAFGRDCIWAKNVKLPCVIFDWPLCVFLRNAMVVLFLQKFMEFKTYVIGNKS